MVGIGADIFHVLVRTQNLIGTVASYTAWSQYNEIEMTKVTFGNLRGRYTYAAASAVLQIFNEVGWVAPMKKVKVTGPQSLQVLDVVQMLLPEPRLQETEFDQNYPEKEWKKKFSSLVYKSQIKESEFMTNIPDLVLLLFMWAAESKKILCSVDIGSDDRIFVDAKGNLLSKKALPHIDLSMMQLRMTHSDCPDESLTVPEVITNLLSIKRDEYTTFRDDGFSFRNMVEELNLNFEEIHAKIVQLRKVKFSTWAKTHFYSKLKDGEMDEDEFVPGEEEEKDDESARKAARGAKKSSGKEVSQEQKPFYFPVTGRFGLTKTEKNKMFPEGESRNTIMQVAPTIDASILMHLEKATRLAVGRAAGNKIDPGLEDHQKFSADYFESSDSKSAQATIAKGLSQDFAALVVAAGKYAVSSAMQSSNDQNPLNAARTVMDGRVDLTPIQMQMSWIAHGLCNDREAADLIRKNSKRIAEPIASDESVADKAELPESRLKRQSQKRELQYLIKLQNVMTKRHFVLVKELMTERIADEKPMLPERFLMYVTCRLLGHQNAFFTEFSRLSRQAGVPPPGKNSELDKLFEDYDTFCDQYTDDRDQFDLEDPRFKELVQRLNDFPVSLVFFQR